MNDKVVSPLDALVSLETSYVPGKFQKLLSQAEKLANKHNYRWEEDHLKGTSQALSFDGIRTGAKHGTLNVYYDHLGNPRLVEFQPTDSKASHAYRAEVQCLEGDCELIANHVDSSVIYKALEQVCVLKLV